MSFATAFKLFLALFFFLFTAVCAAPIQTRDVFVPQVLYPKSGTWWTVGQRHNVTWDISSPPAQITNPVGKIYLRKGQATLLEHTLASDFDITIGRTEITVPDVLPGDDYAVVLFGDSGNFSPVFTIAAVA
jgi:hypothetical protein